MSSTLRLGGAECFILFSAKSRGGVALISRAPLAEISQKNIALYLARRSRRLSRRGRFGHPPARHSASLDFFLGNLRVVPLELVPHPCSGPTLYHPGSNPAATLDW